MPQGTKNITGAIQAYDFRITYGIPTISSNKQQVLIPYTGIANPALTANLTTYQYSTDNGSTWTTMTKSTDTTVSSLSFTASGTSLTFKWEAKTDVGSNLYNNQIRIRLRATSGSLVTDYAMYTLNFERTATNLAQQAATNTPFPEDYSGVPGNELLENAPRSL